VIAEQVGARLIMPGVMADADDYEELWPVYNWSFFEQAGAFRDV
jgi:hypothetical protein